MWIPTVDEAEMAFSNLPWVFTQKGKSALQVRRIVSSCRRGSARSTSAFGLFAFGLFPLSNLSHPASPCR